MRDRLARRSALVGSPGRESRVDLAQVVVENPLAAGAAELRKARVPPVVGGGTPTKCNRLISATPPCRSPAPPLLHRTSVRRRTR